MYTLNITIKVDHEITDAWLQWLKEVQIPATMESDCFTSWHMHKLLGHDEEDGQTFILQFIAPSIAKYHQFVTTCDEQLRTASFAKWGHKAMEFRTVLKKVE